MTTAPEDGGQDAVDEAVRPIVSVNDAPARRFPWMFYLVAAIGFFGVAGGLFWALSNAKPSRLVAAQPSTPKSPGTRIDDKPAFADKPLPQPDAADITPVASSQIFDPRCTDGRPTGSARTPQTPCASHATRSTTPTVSLTAAAADNRTALPSPPDRYGGDVFVAPAQVASAPAAQRLPAPPQEALDVLRRAEAAGFGTVPHKANEARTGNALPSGETARTRPDSASSPESARETRRDAARLLEGRRYLVPRGTQIDCFLTLAYVSDIAGEAHCVAARDVFGHDGVALLIPRGSIANGSFRTSAAEGERRAHVIWDRLVTPYGVVVSFSAKGTDALGGTGLPADVDKRWGERLGVALAISAVKDVSTAVAARRSASQAATEMVSSAQNFANQVLQQTIAIRRSLYVRQGDAASILLQSDLDFSAVHGR